MKDKERLALEQAMDARDRINNVIEMLEDREPSGEDARILEAVQAVLKGTVKSIMLDGKIEIRRAEEL